MERLQKERSIARSNFTKTKNKFIELIEKKSDQIKIQACYELLNKKADALFHIDEKVKEQWLEQAEIDEEDIVKDNEISDVYEEEFYEMKLKFEKIGKASNYDTNSVRDTGKSQTRKLRKLELLKFDGHAKNWLGFWSSFKKIHNDENLDNDDKMAYLIQSMVIDSATYSLVKSFPPCGENYEIALEQLKARYGRDELLIEIYVRELLSLVLQKARDLDILPLASLYDKLKTQLRALETLGVTSDRYASMLYPLVESALPEETLRVWERQRGKGENTDELSKLLDFLKVEVESEERIQLARQSWDIKEEKEATVPSAACLVAADSREEDSSRKGIYNMTATVKCIWCEGNHKSLGCGKGLKMTAEKRIDIATKKKVCFVCFGTNHAEKSLLRVVQEDSLKGKRRGTKHLEIFKDQDKLLKVKTRLTLSEENDNFKTPIQLSSKHPIVEKLVAQRHIQYFQAGVNILFSTLRNNYWILGGKRLAKKIISKCMICKRYSAVKYETPNAPLPKNRVGVGGTETADLDAADNDLNTRQKYLQKLRDDLRQRFRNEYLSLLISQAKTSTRPIQVGDVIIMETEAKRLQWPLGIVEEIHVGKDGQCRVAKVRTTDGYRTRPVQRLYPLEVTTEVNQGAEVNRVIPEGIQSPVPNLTTPDKDYVRVSQNETVQDEDVQVLPRTTRCGRLLKIPRRMDL